MRELPITRLPEYVEEDVCVSEWSTVRVHRQSVKSGVISVG
jgi:hypothetical protein